MCPIHGSLVVLPSTVAHEHVCWRDGPSRGLIGRAASTREVTMFAAKSAAPSADQVSLHHPVIELAADEGITLLEAPAGYLFTDGLAAALADRKRPIVWLRPG